MGPKVSRRACPPQQPCRMGGTPRHLRPPPSGRHIGAMCHDRGPPSAPGHLAQTVPQGGGGWRYLCLFARGWVPDYTPHESPSGRRRRRRVHSLAGPAGGRVAEGGGVRDLRLAAVPPAGRLSRRGCGWAAPGACRSDGSSRGVDTDGTSRPQSGAPMWVGLKNEPITGRGDLPPPQLVPQARAMRRTGGVPPCFATTGARAAATWVPSAPSQSPVRLFQRTKSQRVQKSIQKFNLFKYPDTNTPYGGVEQQVDVGLRSSHILPSE